MNSVVTPDFYKIVFLAFERDGLSEGLCTAVAITIHYTRFPNFTPNYPKLSQVSQITKRSTLLTDRHGKSIISVLHMSKKKYFSLAVFFWTNVMAWDIYKTFGQRTILSHIRPTGKDHNQIIIRIQS